MREAFENYNGRDFIVCRKSPFPHQPGGDYRCTLLKYPSIRKDAPEQADLGNFEMVQTSGIGVDQQTFDDTVIIRPQEGVICGQMLSKPEDYDKLRYRYIGNPNRSLNTLLCAVEDLFLYHNTISELEKKGQKI